MALGIRQKITLGASSLLLFLLALGVLSLVLLHRYSVTLEVTFRDNYDSVIYGQGMKDAVDTLDDLTQQALWDGPQAWDKAAAARAIGDFERHLRQEQRNVTLPSEDKLATQIADTWQHYQQQLPITQPGSNSEVYRQQLRPLSQQLKALSQQIIDINMANIVAVDNRVQSNTAKARQATYIILLSGIGLTMLATVLAARSLLKPLALLTQSAREIARGNLDLSVTVLAKDELGELAKAFNSMTARLREFRSSDRAKLYRTQKTTQLAIDSFPDAVAVVGVDGKVELANHKARTNFHLTPGSELATLEPASLWDMFQKACHTLAPVTGKGYENVLQIFEQGDEQFYLPQAVPIVADDQSLVGVTLVLANVTPLRRMDEMKSGLLSVASHELKTPLTSIRMAMHLLLSERAGPLTAKQSELLVTANDDTERLQRIIETLLDLGRMEAGRAAMNLQAQSCEILLQDAIAPFHTAYRDHGLTLQWHLDEHLPKVLVDQTRIQHVFSNILSNALAYTKAGGSVTLAASRAMGMMVQITITDTGVGIPLEYQSQVFERFFRVPGSTVATGAGLGLAIAREIVQAHGGELWLAHSQTPGGSSFAFTLRAVEDHQDASPS